MPTTTALDFDTTGLDTVKLRGGCGSGEDGDCCFVQDVRRRMKLPAKSYDCPPTASPVLHPLFVQLNDSSDVWRGHLVAFEEAFAFSRSTPAVEERRAARIVDWALRDMLPQAIDAVVALGDGDSAQTRELSRLAQELRDSKPVSADLADLAARADLADLAARADLADLADLAARADLADLAARAALADLAARADLAALAALADLADLAALAKSEEEIWPSISTLLTELLAMKDAPDAAAAQET